MEEGMTPKQRVTLEAFIRFVEPGVTTPSSMVPEIQTDGVDSMRAALSEIDALEARLADTHCLLQGAYAAVDPAVWPELSARLFAALGSCELPQCQHASEAFAARDAAEARLAAVASAFHDADQLSTPGDMGCFVPWGAWEALQEAAEGE
jgi:hypothetical protein